MIAAVALAVLAMQKGMLSKPWFGPVTATFNVMFPGNPYDPDENDLRVKFTSDTGHSFERLAYFDGISAFRSTLITPEAGKYKAELFRNGQPLQEPDQEGVLDATRPLPRGFIHPDPLHTNRFAYDDGSPYFPIGHNLGWKGGAISLPDQIALMGSNGINWTRIWACAWDGKNPWWPPADVDQTQYHSGWLWTPALTNWQSIVDASDKAGVDFQFVLFHHGEFSSTTNPNWQDCPWNVKNGGFLKSAEDFFTDPEAKRRAKIWLRYAVARYGASPSVLSWELFNEVQWVDAASKNHWPVIVDWHKEMAAYIRSIDPYKHMITTSSVLEPHELYSAMDYYQPHTYPPDVLASVSGTELPTDKPAFFGEFGPPDKNVNKAIRDGVYGAILSNQAGTGMFWSWDEVQPSGGYAEYKAAAHVLVLSQLATHPGAKVFKVLTKTEGVGDVSFGPGAGWQKSTAGPIEVPDGLTPKAMASLSGYLQSSTAHADMYEPIVLRFTARKAGQVKLHISEVSRSGAKPRIMLNGQTAVSKSFESSANGLHPNEDLIADFHPGQNEVRVENDGPDWAVVGKITIAGIGAQASAMAIGEADWAIVRVLSAEGAPADVKADLSGVGVADGSFDLYQINPVTGEELHTQVEIKDWKLPNVQVKGGDTILVLRKR